MLDPIGDTWPLDFYGFPDTSLSDLSLNQSSATSSTTEDLNNYYYNPSPPQMTNFAYNNSNKGTETYQSLPTTDRSNSQPQGHYINNHSNQPPYSEINNNFYGGTFKNNIDTLDHFDPNSTSKLNEIRLDDIRTSTPIDLPHFDHQIPSNLYQPPPLSSIWSSTNSQHCYDSNQIETIQYPRNSEGTIQYQSNNEDTIQYQQYHSNNEGTIQYHSNNEGAVQYHSNNSISLDSSPSDISGNWSVNSNPSYMTFSESDIMKYTCPSTDMEMDGSKQVEMMSKTNAYQPNQEPCQYFQHQNLRYYNSAHRILPMQDDISNNNEKLMTGPTDSYNMGLRVNVSPHNPTEFPAYPLAQYSLHPNSPTLMNNTQMHSTSNNDPVGNKHSRLLNQVIKVKEEQHSLIKNSKSKKDDQNQDESIRTKLEPSQISICKWIDCHQTFTNCDFLVSHIERSHVDQRNLKDEYTCFWQGCARRHRPFNARYKLLIHMRVHSGEKPNKCSGAAISSNLTSTHENGEHTSS